MRGFLSRTHGRKKRLGNTVLSDSFSVSFSHESIKECRARIDFLFQNMTQTRHLSMKISVKMSFSSVACFKYSLFCNTTESTSKKCTLNLSIRLPRATNISFLDVNSEFWAMHRPSHLILVSYIQCVSRHPSEPHAFSLVLRKPIRWKQLHNGLINKY